MHCTFARPCNNVQCKTERETRSGKEVKWWVPDETKLNWIELSTSETVQNIHWLAAANFSSKPPFPLPAPNQTKTKTKYISFPRKKAWWLVFFFFWMPMQKDGWIDGWNTVVQSSTGEKTRKKKLKEVKEGKKRKEKRKDRHLRPQSPKQKQKHNVEIT